MKILTEVSARHVHLDEESLKKLFGNDYNLTVKRNLSQPGQFLSNEKVEIIGPKSSIKNVSILGPVREKTQVEISKTDARCVGIDAPIRESGDLKNSPGCRLVGPAGEIELNEGVIVAKRHAHLTPDTAEKIGVSDGQLVQVQINSEERSLIFGDVVVRVSKKFAPAVHIDTDEANAVNVSCSCYAELKV